jgi:hypothetical protein
MSATAPVNVIALVTAQALSTLLFRCVPGIFAKTDVSDFLRELGVLTTGAVAGFAGPLGTRTAHIILDKMVGPQNRGNFVVIVALQTGLCTPA